MNEFVKVAQAPEIENGQNKVVYFRQQEVVIFNSNGNFYALNNLCPHRQAPLSAGQVENGVVTCPHHGARFDLRTGKGLKGPHRSNIGCYAVKIEGADIKISSRSNDE